jgi:sec-independent protein translocase protein TatB
VLNLDPAKVLVVLVVALVVLGPDKLPRAARQLGAAWNQLRRWRSRLEEEVRGTFPDLPPASTIGEAVRSPLRFLDRLADEHDGSDPAGGTPSPAGATPATRAVPDPGAPGHVPAARRPGPPPAGDPSMN